MSALSNCTYSMNSQPFYGDPGYLDMTVRPDSTLDWTYRPPTSAPNPPWIVSPTLPSLPNIPWVDTQIQPMVPRPSEDFIDIAPREVMQMTASQYQLLRDGVISIEEARLMFGLPQQFSMEARQVYAPKRIVTETSRQFDL